MNEDSFAVTPEEFAAQLREYLECANELGIRDQMVEEIELALLREQMEALS